MPLRYLVLYVLLAPSVFLTAQKTQEGLDLKNQVYKEVDTNNIKTNGPVIYFSNTTHNIGSVEQGSNLTYEFDFTNNGNEALLITNVRASCNCTVASYPKTPILPEKNEKITLKLDTSIPGSFNKVIAVYSNAINDVDNEIGKSRIVLNVIWSIIEKKKDSE